MAFSTWLYTLWKGKLVGTDQFGNRYFREKSPRPLRRGGGYDSRERRWVLYKGEAEASKVPPEWHGWLHYTVDEIPAAAGAPKYAWQKPHLPNLTGTRHAYRPSGSLLKGGRRAPTTGDYEPWRPE